MKNMIRTRFTGEDCRLRAAAAYETLVGLLPYTGATNIEWSYVEGNNGGTVKVEWNGGPIGEQVEMIIRRAMGE